MGHSNRSMTSLRSNRSMTSLQCAKVKVATAQLKLKYLEQVAQVQAQQVQTQLLMNKLKTERELEESKILISVLTEDDSKVHANSTLVKTKLSADAGFHIQDSSSPSTNLPPHCQDSSIPQHIDLDQSEISQVDISKDSSVSNTISTEEVLVIEGQFNDVSSSRSRSCSTELPPSHVLCPTPESDTEVIKLCSLHDKQLVRLFDEDKKELLLSPSTVIPNYVPDVVCGQNNAGVSTHVLSSNVVTFPSHSDSFNRSSQFCYVICAQKTDLPRILTVSFSFMKSVIFVLPLGFVDSDRRFLKKKRKVR